MKIAIVPAQITTVEDKVAGNLSLTQLIILVLPVFGSGLFYAVAPPSFGVAIYKLAIIFLLFLMFAPLAIKVRGNLLIIWMIILIRYNIRPQFHVFNKNSNYLRDIDVEAKSKTTKKPIVTAKQPVRLPTAAIDISDKARLEAMIANPNAKLSFKISKKGGLDVYITEVE